MLGFFRGPLVASLVVLALVSFDALAKVIIIGGGAAGLMAADLLRESGVSYALYEQNSIVGGRVTSRNDLSGMGLVLDEGANLVNSTDEVLLNLIRSMQIEFVERFPNGEESWMYLLNGKVLNQKQLDQLLFAKNRSAFAQIFKDQESPREEYFRATSIAQYLNEIGANDDLKKVFHAFFISEFGRTLDDLNVNVLFEYLTVDMDRETFLFIPYYDEAYSLPGGTGQITRRLGERNEDHIYLSHTVTSIIQSESGSFEVSGMGPNGEFRDSAEQIIFAAPLIALNSMDVQVKNLPQVALDEARAATYGQGMKLHLKFKAGFRELYQFRGIFLTENGEQIWTSSQGQPGESGLLTVLRGMGEPNIEMILASLEELAPGIRELYVGYERTDAPFTYSGAFRPGEATRLKIHDSDSPQWITIGEASDAEFQGYFEGAVRSAKVGTEGLLKTGCLELLKTGSGN